MPRVKRMPTPPKRRNASMAVAKNLCGMLVGKSFGGFQLNNEPALHQQVSVIVADEGTVLVIHLNRILLSNVQSRFAQPMGKRVLIDFFQVSMAMINVNVIGDLPNLRTQFLDVFHRFFLCVLCGLCGSFSSAIEGCSTE